MAKESLTLFMTEGKNRYPLTYLEGYILFSPLGWVTENLSYLNGSESVLHPLISLDFSVRYLTSQNNREQTY